MQSVAKLLRHEIRQSGPIPFARFMEAALYEPRLGYYERAPNQIGRHGDFYTSVSVGSFFGQLLAFQFARWLEPLATSNVTRLQIVEAGAHHGQLASDILTALQSTEPFIFSKVEYVIVEPSATRRAAQQHKLAPFRNVRWIDDWFATSTAAFCGVVFSNELLDSFPVHRFIWNRATHQWQEAGVAFEGDAFIWTRLSSPTTPPPDLPSALLEVLPDGYIIDLAPEVRRWWEHAALALAKGKLITIDYGGTLEEILSPARTSGTLRAYARHHLAGDILAVPGEQDLTAHVNFTEIRQAGEQAGLKTEIFTTQSQFLTAIAREWWGRNGSWPPDQVRQFQTLTHPEHLGRPFRVLVQARP